MYGLRFFSYIFLIFITVNSGLFAQFYTYTTATIEELEITSDAAIYASRANDDSIEIEMEVGFDQAIAYGYFLGTNVFSVRFQLIDENDVVVRTQSELIGERTTVSSETFNYSLETTTQLDVNKRYFIRAQLLRSPVNSYQPLQNVGSAMDTPLVRYYHFFNTHSNDAALNVLFHFDEVEWQRLFAIRTSETQQSFQAEVIGDLLRYDAYSGPAGSDDVEFVFTYELVDSETDLAVDTVSNESRQTVSLGRYYMHGGVKYPWQLPNFIFTIDVEPVGQLDSVNKAYYLRVTGAHVEEPGEEPVEAGVDVAAAHRLLHFNGDLDFGGVATTFTEVSNAPTFWSGGLNYINTSLQVSNQTGTVTTWDVLEYGADELLNEVRLMADGTASVQGGEVALVPGEGTVAEDVIKQSGDIQYTLINLKLTPDGPVAGEDIAGASANGLNLLLPSGTGYSIDHFALNHTRLLDIINMSGPLELDAQFNPKHSLSTEPSNQTWLHQEGRPYGIEVEEITFDFIQKEIRFDALGVAYNHAFALNALESQLAHLDTPEMAVKPSNEQYYRFADAVYGQVVVKADANGRALVDSELSLTAGQFTPHFPLSGPVEWHGAGHVIQVGSLIDPQGSRLQQVKAINLTYHQSCPDAFCELGEPPVETLTWLADNGILTLTPDGGLSGVGEINQEDLEWGYLETVGGTQSLYAHRTGEFERAQFLVAGHALVGSASLWNDSSAAADYDFDQSPSALLLAGYNRDLNVHERFGTPEYILGVGDYAGVNFRVDDFTITAGFSRIGRPDPAVPDFAFTPETNTKYYVRPAGVSGVHEAQEESFDESLTIYGYTFKIVNYGLSFLDSENHESQVNGALFVPGPAGFAQSFLELTMSCVGELENAELDPADLGAKDLLYWNGSFEPKGIRFLAPTGDDSCNRTGDPVLALGVTTEVAHVDGVLFGEMGFFPTGQIVAPADGYPVTSRFQLPAQLELDGPSDEASYTMTPVSPLYFNDEANGPADRGFVTFAATQDVPFFVDVLVQIMTNADASSSAAFDIVGGWPNQGWKELGEDYFTLADFDSENIGWPSADVADYDDYRRPAIGAPDQYSPVALQSFFGVLNFEYPLKWNTSARYYRSFESKTNDLMVLNIDHSVDYLSAEFIEVSFGAQYDGLPQLNLSNMLFTAVGENLGAGQAFVEGVQAEVVESIEGGIDGVAEMLNDRIDEFYAELFNRIDSLVLDPLYDELSAEFENALDAAQTGGPAYFSNYRANYATPLLDEYVYDPANPRDGLLFQQLDQLRGSLNAPFGIVKEVDQRLATLEQTLAAISGQLYITQNGIEVELPNVGLERTVPGILSKNEDGVRDVVTNLIVALIGDLVEEPLGTMVAEQLTQGETAIQQQLDELLAQAEPTLAEIDKIVGDLRTEVTEIRAKLAESGEIHDAIIVILDEAEAEVLNVAISVRTEADDFLDELQSDYNRLYPSDQLESIRNPFEEYPREEVTALLRKKLVDEVGVAPFVKEIQYTLKQYLYDLNGSVENTIDNAFAEVNLMIRELIAETVGDLEKDINPMLSDLGDSVGSGEIDGVARFRGDALVRLRLDGSFQWQVPKPLQFRGYLEYLQLDSDGPGSCGAGSGDKLTEVSLGALDVPLEWISPGMRADVGAKFSMLYDPGTQAISPAGLAGSFQMTGGGLDFEAFEIFDLKAAVAFGLHENYIAAAAGMIVSNYEASGGIFLGRSCSSDPIVLIDPLAGEVIGEGVFTGGYAYGEAWIPVSEAALGIPASCMFRVSAGVGAGVFYFMEGPVFGGRMTLGVSGEALCAVSIRGDVSLVGVKEAGDFRFNGRGRLQGKVGPCPFCLKFSKTAKVKYDSQWSVDL